MQVWSQDRRNKNPSEARYRDSLDEQVEQFRRSQAEGEPGWTGDVSLECLQIHLGRQAEIKQMMELAHDAVWDAEARGVGAAELMPLRARAAELQREANAARGRIACPPAEDLASRSHASIIAEVVAARPACLEGGIEDQARERREARKREFEERRRRAEEAHQRQLEKEREHQQRIVAREKQTLAELIKEGLAENPTLLMQMTLLQMRRERGEIDKTQYELMCNVIAEDCMAYMKGETGMPQPDCHVSSLKIRGEKETNIRELGIIHSMVIDAKTGQKFVTTVCAVYELLKGGTARLLAGSSVEEDSPEEPHRDGQGADARFFGLFGCDMNADGDLVLCDTNNHCLRKVTRNGEVTTIAGEPDKDVRWAARGEAEVKGDGKACHVHLVMPYGVVCDKRDGSVYFTEAGSHRIRRLSTDGFVSTVAGHSHGGFHDGEGAQACLNFPMGLTMDLHGDLIVADSHNHVIRRVQLVPEGSGALQAAAGSDRGDIVVGRVTTIAGPPPPPGGFEGEQVDEDMGFSLVHESANSGFQDGRAELSRFMSPRDVLVDGCNNILIAEAGSRLRMLSHVPKTPVASHLLGDLLNSSNTHFASWVTTLVGSKVHQGEKGSRDGPGKTALLKHPTTICLDASGRVFIGDGQQGVLRIVDASLPWAIARLLYIAVLKSKGSQGGDRAKRDGVDEDAAAQEGCEWAAWAGLKTHKEKQKSSENDSRSTPQDTAASGGDVGDCGKSSLFALLPVEGDKGMTCPLLQRIIRMAAGIAPRAA